MARGDLLIALHLALDMVRDCCVLGMMLRDRTEGTDRHREGGIGNRFVAELGAVGQPATAAGILTTIIVSDPANHYGVTGYKPEMANTSQP